MRISLSIFLLFVFAATGSQAQTDPNIRSWIRNTSGATGYSGILSNVQTVQYSTGWVYVSCTGIPSYNIGPWVGNPNVAANQNFVHKITRTPQAKTGTPTAVGLGHIGVWTNGVSMFNADDGMTYLNQGVWHRNAYFWEGSSFDGCLGHPQQSGEYHHHANPKCLYNDADNSKHSPIIGWAFDGYPVYGAFGYTNVDGTGGIKRMTSSYQLRNITQRTTLPDGSTASSPGPAISTQYPIGAYMQDYVFTQGAGDLDAHNGRFTVTPEYPSGTYAYFVTIDAAGTPVYPYVLGDSYYGIVPAGSTGPGSGHATISEATTVYTGPTSTGTISPVIQIEVLPNPVSNMMSLWIGAGSLNNISGVVLDATGRVVTRLEYLQPGVNYWVDCSRWANGSYFLSLASGDKRLTQAIVVRH